MWQLSRPFNGAEVACVGFALVPLAGGCGGERESVVALAATDVVTIQVEVRRDKGPKLGPFLAATEDYERILGLLRGGVVDHRPAKWQALGLVLIETRAGRVIAVNLYRTGQEAVAYCIGQTYYRGCSEFISVLADCASRSAKNYTPPSD
jgi:hypothetical protein